MLANIAIFGKDVINAADVQAPAGRAVLQVAVQQRQLLCVALLPGSRHLRPRRGEQQANQQTAGEQFLQIYGHGHLPFVARRYWTISQ